MRHLEMLRTVCGGRQKGMFHYAEIETVVYNAFHCLQT